MTMLTGKNSFDDCTVIVPTLNESGGIEFLLTSIVTNYPNISCIVADDESSDGTQEIVNQFSKRYKNVHLLARSAESIKGLSASICDGILSCETQYFVVMDGDNQHPPEFIINCVESLEMGSDLCIGTRSPFGKKWLFSRIIISFFANSLARIRLLFNGVTVNDPMSGFFGGRTDFIKYILEEHANRIELRGYKILFDILKIIPEKTKISGFFFPFGLRGHDNSKFHIKLIYYFFLSCFK